MTLRSVLLPCLLIGGLVCLVFSPTIGAELLSVDDSEMYGWLINHAEIDLVGLFLPGANQGGYYRPVIGLTFLLERVVHGASLPLMHLLNILIHTLNAMFVYLLAQRLLCRHGDDAPRFAAVAAALLFGVHPLTTESVAWLSGRTDPLSIFFVLLSMLLFFRWWRERKIRLVFFAVGCTLLGIMTKESVLAFIPAALLLMTGDDRSLGGAESHEFSTIEFLLFAAAAIISLLISFNVAYPLIISLCYPVSILVRTSRRSPLTLTRTAVMRVIAAAGILLIVPSLLFLVIRRVVFASDTGKISDTFRVMFDDPNYTFMTFLGAAGFYVKKTVVPLPLNFAIREIDPLYQLIGVVSLLLCLFCLMRRNLADRLVVAGFIMLLPSFLISFGTIAWTAYAERYVYPSLPFWSMALAVSISRVEHCRRVRVLSILLLLFFGAITFHRSITWRTNLDLIGDTVEKTPQFRTLRETYMAVLMNRGDYAGAREQYEIGKRIVTVGYDPELDIRMAELLRREGKREESWKMFERIIEKTRGGRPDVTERYLIQLSDARQAERSPEGRERILRKMIRCRELLFDATMDPRHLYYAGKLAFEGGDPLSAARYFIRASEIFPPSDPYHDISRRFGKRLLGAEFPLS